jgi:hypothetical protein
MTLNYHGNGLMVNSIGTRQNKDVPNVKPFNCSLRSIDITSKFLFAGCRVAVRRSMLRRYILRA